MVQSSTGHLAGVFADVTELDTRRNRFNSSTRPASESVVVCVTLSELVADKDGLGSCKQPHIYRIASQRRTMPQLASKRRCEGIV